MPETPQIVGPRARRPRRRSAGGGLLPGGGRRRVGAAAAAGGGDRAAGGSRPGWEGRTTSSAWTASPRAAVRWSRCAGWASAEELTARRLADWLARTVEAAEVGWLPAAVPAPPRSPQVMGDGGPRTGRAAPALSAATASTATAATATRPRREWASWPFCRRLPGWPTTARRAPGRRRWPAARCSAATSRTARPTRRRPTGWKRGRASWPPAWG